MAIFNLNFLLKVGQVEMCQNPSPISTYYANEVRVIMQMRLGLCISVEARVRVIMQMKLGLGLG